MRSARAALLCLVRPSVSYHTYLHRLKTPLRYTIGTHSHGIPHHRDDKKNLKQKGKEQIHLPVQGYISDSGPRPSPNSSPGFKVETRQYLSIRKHNAFIEISIQTYIYYYTAGAFNNDIPLTFSFLPLALPASSLEPRRRKKSKMWQTI